MFTARLLAAIFVALWLPGCTQPETARLTVFAAASLRDVLPPLGEAYTRETGMPVDFHFAGSTSLVNQIRGGAPADVLITADLESAESLRPRRSTVVASNVLVLAGPARLGREGWPERLRAAQRLALGNPQTVPAGRYAQEGLMHLGLWDAVSPKVVPCLDVRAAQALVTSGGADVAAVYRTDVGADLVSLWEFPAGSHRPIRYPACVVPGSRQPERAAGLVAFLAGSAGLKAFRQAGFGPPDQ
ncbi:MAG: molybdate ABC transporter substrate-binding protein [Candidatus Eremiobacterota bacterium]